MKKLLILIATVLIASPAQAAPGCMGKVIVGAEWTTFENTAVVPHPKEMARYVPSNACLFKTKSAVGQRILAKCPNGTQCTVYLSGPNKLDHHIDAAETTLTITKHPMYGVTRH